VRREATQSAYVGAPDVDDVAMFAVETGWEGHRGDESRWKARVGGRWAGAAEAARCCQVRNLTMLDLVSLGSFLGG
jgi:hypothetical protein